MITLHWIWLLVAFSLGTCVGFLAFGLVSNLGSGDYYPSIEDAEQAYRPRRNLYRIDRRGE